MRSAGPAHREEVPVGIRAGRPACGAEGPGCPQDRRGGPRGCADSSAPTSPARPGRSPSNPKGRPCRPADERRRSDGCCRRSGWRWPVGPEHGRRAGWAWLPVDTVCCGWFAARTTRRSASSRCSGSTTSRRAADMSTARAMLSRRPVDPRAGREMKTFAGWPGDHPGVGVTCRDRAGAHAERSATSMSRGIGLFRWPTSPRRRCRRPRRGSCLARSGRGRCGRQRRVASGRWSGRGAGCGPRSPGVGGRGLRSGSRDVAPCGPSHGAVRWNAARRVSPCDRGPRRPRGCWGPRCADSARPPGGRRRPCAGEPGPRRTGMRPDATNSLTVPHARHRGRRPSIRPRSDRTRCTGMPDVHGGAPGHGGTA
jgi:hypothetical protein